MTKKNLWSIVVKRKKKLRRKKKLKVKRVGRREKKLKSVKNYWKEKVRKMIFFKRNNNKIRGKHYKNFRGKNFGRG